MKRTLTTTVLILGLLLPASAQAETLEVCDTCAHTTIAAALALALSGDVVEVSPGTYAGCLVVPENVTVAGDAAFPAAVVIDGTRSTDSLAVCGENQSQVIAIT